MSEGVKECYIFWFFAKFRGALCSLGKNVQFCRDQVNEYEELPDQSSKVKSYLLKNFTYISDYCEPKLIASTFVCFPVAPKGSVAKIPCPHYITVNNIDGK